MAILGPDGHTILSNASPTSLEIKKGLGSFQDDKISGDWSVYFPHPSSISRLSYKMLRNIYSLSSSVRPAVDAIVREVTSLEWMVSHIDMTHHESKSIDDAKTFLKMVNLDGEDISTVLSKFLVDLLVVSKGVIEKVRNPLGQVIELVARDASLYQPIYDNDGQGIIGYQEYERMTYKKITVHKKEDIIFRLFTPLSYSAGSVPIIETIVNEVALLMLAVKSIAWAFTHDEIPPGILVLGEIGAEAIERAKASFEAAKGDYGKNKLRVIDNVDKVSWVQLSRPFHEMQVAELLPFIEKIVARNFGLSATEAGISDTSKSGAQVSVQSSQAKLIIPLINLISNVINGVLKEMDPDLVFTFIDAPQDKLAERVTSYTTLWRSGLASRNEIRLKLGFQTVNGGDIYTVLLGNQVVPLDPKTGLPPPLPVAPTDGTNASDRQTGNNPVKQKLPAPAPTGTLPAKQQASLDLDDDDFMEIFDLEGDEVKKNF